jgi:hypothetical protein
MMKKRKFNCWFKLSFASSMVATILNRKFSSKEASHKMLPSKPIHTFLKIDIVFGHNRSYELVAKYIHEYPFYEKGLMGENMIKYTKKVILLGKKTQICDKYIRK